MILSFHDPSERALMISLLKADSARSDESFVADVPCKNLSIQAAPQARAMTTTTTTTTTKTTTSTATAPRSPSPPSGADLLRGFGWQQLRVLNKDPEDPDKDFAPTVLSESLRICVDSRCGTITDRINLGKRTVEVAVNHG